MRRGGERREWNARTDPKMFINKRRLSSLLIEKDGIVDETEGSNVNGCKSCSLKITYVIRESVGVSIKH